MASAGKNVLYERRGRSRCVCGYDLLRMGRPLRGRRCSGRGRTSDMRVTGEDWDAQAVLQDRSHEISVPVKEGGGGSAHSAPGTWWS